MAHLGVPENEIVLVRSTSLPKATFMKLQPHTKDFLHVPNPKEL
jgi:ubiquitin fusion degradation protein 1